MGRRRRSRRDREKAPEQRELLDASEVEEDEETSPGDPDEDARDVEAGGEREAAPDAEAGEAREAVPAEAASDPSPEPGDPEDADIVPGSGDGPDDTSGGAPGTPWSEAHRVPDPRDWRERVREREDLRDVEGALAVVRGELERNPDHPALLEAEIQILGTLGRFEAAERPLARLREVVGNTAQLRRAAGVLLFRRGMYPEAREELQACVAREDGPASGEVHYYLGETLNRMGRVDQAMEVLHRAVELDPTLARAYNTLGRLLDQKGDRDEAARMYRLAREAEA